MALLPSGLVAPPLWVVVVLGTLSAAQIAVLYVLSPPVTHEQVVGFTPWMVSGGILHVLYQIGTVPATYAPLFSAPAVYVTTFVSLGFVWTSTSYLARSDDDPDRISRDVGAIGSGVLLVLIGLVYWEALGLTGGWGPLAWPAVGFLVALFVFVPLYYLLASWQTGAVATVGLAGATAVFAHLLDGVSTAIGVDLLGTTERTPLPRYIMDIAARLPTAEYIGRGWLFVVVKVLVAIGAVLLLADYADEDPNEANLLLAFVTALGLGPASNNLFLFVVSGAVPG